LATNSATNSAPTSPQAQLDISPSTMNFGTVAVGSSQNQNGSLSARGADIQVSTASWNGQGYVLSGISFPKTIPAGTSVPFTVTFTPQSSGAVNGQLSFLSDASNSPPVVSLTGTGGQAQYSVTLSWNASASEVVGYNLYRTEPGGSYARLNTALITVLTYTDGSPQSGKTYSYAATSVDESHVESAFSNPVTVVIP
jgi:Abnormal spindle-like microcephaly-assoc'd, ASPM-SPD-2-Hydin